MLVGNVAKDPAFHATRDLGIDYSFVVRLLASGCHGVRVDPAPEHPNGLSAFCRDDRRREFEVKFNLLRLDDREIVAIVTAYELDQAGSADRYRTPRRHRPEAD
jgi:hypothetical protein